MERERKKIEKIRKSYKRSTYDTNLSQSVDLKGDSQFDFESFTNASVVKPFSRRKPRNFDAIEIMESNVKGRQSPWRPTT